MKTIFDVSLWEDELIALGNQREKERLASLTKTVETLKRYFANKKVEQVYLIGSIIRKGSFYPNSDIDVAVESLKEDYFRIFGELERLLERGIDLIEIDNCRFRDRIMAEGIRIL